MSPHGRTVNQEAPSYREGVDLANKILDHTGEDVDVLILMGEAAAYRYHEQEDNEGYSRARGFLETLREYLADRS